MEFVRKPKNLFKEPPSLKFASSTIYIRTCYALRRKICVLICGGITEYYFACCLFELKSFHYVQCTHSLQFNNLSSIEKYNTKHKTAKGILMGNKQNAENQSKNALRSNAFACRRHWNRGKTKLLTTFKYSYIYLYYITQL